MILLPGTKVVTLIDLVDPEEDRLHPKGSVAVVVRSPGSLEADGPYFIRFPEGSELAIPRDQVVLLAKFKEGELGERQAKFRSELFEYAIYRCVIGSRAYGLDDENSDIDYRGIYLPPADLHWSLHGVPEQLECHETQEAYWELQKFLILALKANPNVLECLYTPLVEKTTPLAEELISLRAIFLSKLVYQTFHGYVMSQFKKMQSDLRHEGQPGHEPRVKWKHVMHLIRLLITGITVLRDGFVPVKVEEHRHDLLAIKKGEWSWSQTEEWRKRLHAEFDRAFQMTRLPDRPDYEKANHFLIKARRAALQKDLP